ncbi:MAG: hypothetical protein ACLPN6_13950 [Streptosporangiaceae bacterium]|jgi:hypothetical protein
MSGWKIAGIVLAAMLIGGGLFIGGVLVIVLVGLSRYGSSK